MREGAFFAASFARPRAPRSVEHASECRGWHGGQSEGAGGCPAGPARALSPTPLFSPLSFAPPTCTPPWNARSIAATRVKARGDMVAGAGEESGECAAGRPVSDRALAPMWPSAPRPPTPAPSIAVVGAGVIGLATAVRVADALPRARVALVAASTAHADTTSAGAAGLWEVREKERGGGGGGNAGR